MYATIIGDLVGSPYEFVPLKTTEFDFWSECTSFTDDTVMTVAVAEGIMDAGVDAELNEIKECILCSMRKMGAEMFPLVGYGERFFQWLHQKNPQPYNSYGNGAAMRVSSIAYFYPDDLERALEVARISAEVSHNHPEAIKAVECVTQVIWMANKHLKKDEIKK